MSILVDFNQVMIATISAGSSVFGSELNPDMIRHMFLSSIVGYKKKFGAKYGEIIVCCDGPGSWRKEFFPYYKAKRAQGRADSPLDWEMIFATLTSMYTEIDEFFPYKIVRVDRAEGDDVVAILAKYLQTNELTYKGLEEAKQDIIVISSDGDFIQLQEYGNVEQWSPMFKKLVREANPRLYRFNKIIGGDAGDGVPNVFSDDDIFVSEPKRRQTPATEKRIAPILEAALAGTKIPVEHERNYDRNKTCIDLMECIPKDIEDAIIECYKNAKVSPRSELLSYFMKFRLKNLASDIGKF